MDSPLIEIIDSLDQRLDEVEFDEALERLGQIREKASSADPYMPSPDFRDAHVDLYGQPFPKWARKAAQQQVERGQEQAAEGLTFVKSAIDNGYLTALTVGSRRTVYQGGIKPGMTLHDTSSITPTMSSAVRKRRGRPRKNAAAAAPPRKSTSSSKPPVPKIPTAPKQPRSSGPVATRFSSRHESKYYWADGTPALSPAGSSTAPSSSSPASLAASAEEMDCGSSSDYASSDDEMHVE
ncbi:hypothetical protein OBBRIDRAFT_830920 [Obba rivulosa]|uniref:Uncharacterized protein n=1 Tax=Obba rivulosa TaxID=1052685 RepID=A0A8E2DT70_9APHY|nr:hypothetical protein OBBRIDRAFT_830920 [Obba rivulosa]